MLALLDDAAIAAPAHYEAIRMSSLVMVWGWRSLDPLHSPYAASARARDRRSSWHRRDGLSLPDRARRALWHVVTPVPTPSDAERTLLLTGATGFVGSAVRPALERAGWRVRGLTRNAARAATRSPTLDWVQGDVADRDAMARALEGVAATLYLVHGIREGAGYHEREVAAAADFAAVAAASGVERIVYLGGVAPVGPGSEHLRSRLEVGETLRTGAVPTIELRASMIVGHGSLSWLIVRDLAARLPVMILPRWLRSRTEPVAIDDVVVAVVRTFDLPSEVNGWFDIPGPEILSGKEILDRTAVLMGLGAPHSIDVPFLSPRLSSLWIRMVTRADWSVAREIVIGLTEDLLAGDDDFWARIDHPQRISFDRAARRALAAERGSRPARGPWALVERARGVTHDDDDG